MRKNLLPSAFFALLAVCLAGLALYAVMTCRNIRPVLVYGGQEASARAEELMDAVCSGNFEGAEKLLLGTPDLGADRKPEDPVGRMIWDAYLNSLDYRMVGGIYPTDRGIAQDVKIISLELSTATEQLGARARELLNERMETAQDVGQLYDENNEYREELVMEVLQDAARQALEEDVRYGYQVVTLNFTYQDDQWWILADQNFLNAISGGVAG